MDFDEMFLQVKEMCTARIKDFYEERMASKDAEIAQLQAKLSRSEYLVDKYRTSMQTYILATAKCRKSLDQASGEALSANSFLTIHQDMTWSKQAKIEALQWENDDLLEQVKSLELMLERHGFFDAGEKNQLPEESNCSYENDDYVEPSNSSNSNRNNSTRSLRYMNFSSDLPSILEEDEEECEEEGDLSTSVPQQPLPAIRSAIFMRKSLEGIPANFIDGSPSATSSPIFIKKDCADKNSEQKKPGLPFANAITVKSLETSPAIAMNPLKQLPKSPSPLPAAPKKKSIAASQLTPPFSPLPTASEKKCIVKEVPSSEPSLTINEKQEQPPKSLPAGIKKPLSTASEKKCIVKEVPSPKPSLTFNEKQEQPPKPLPAGIKKPSSAASEKKCIVKEVPSSKPSLTFNEKQEQPPEPLPAGNKKRTDKKDKKSKTKPKYNSFYSFAIY